MQRRHPNGAVLVQIHAVSGADPIRIVVVHRLDVPALRNILLRAPVPPR